MTTKQKELYAAANLLATNCANQKGCFGCAFQIDRDGCLLNRKPSDWPIFNAFAWTTADIALAKALRMMGYTHIICSRDSYGSRTVEARRPMSGIHLNDKIPPTAFPLAKDGIVYDLKQIIQGGSV